MDGAISRRALLGSALLAQTACAPASIALPVDAPRTRGIQAPRFEDAARRASDLIATHRVRVGAPSLSAALAIAGALVWSEAVGFADVAARTAATPHTRYRIGSTSKAVTVTLTARLVEMGVVAWDEPIGSYKRELPAKWRALTLRQLHSHTAGIPGYETNTDLAGLWASWRKQRHYDDVADALSEFDDAAMLSRPGQAFHYSSFDVALASAVLQAAGGAPFLDLLARYVLAPLGMQETGADFTDRVVPNRARFYQRAGEGAVWPSRFVDLSGRWASGGLCSTSADVVRLGASYHTAALLQPSTIQTLWTAQQLANGAVNEQSYALGWRSARTLSEPFGRTLWRVHHGGVSTGAMSALILYPELGITLAMNINTEAETFGAFAAPLDRIAKLFAQVV